MTLKNILLNIRRKDLIIEGLFIFIISILFLKSKVFFYNGVTFKFISAFKFISSLNILIVLLTLYSIIFNNNYKKNISSLQINNNSKSLYVAVYYIIFNFVINMVNNKIELTQEMIFFLAVMNIVGLLFVCRIFRINIFNFRYNISFLWLFAIMFMFFFIKDLRPMSISENYSIVGFIIVLAIHLITNYGLEEVVFRGLMFSGLKNLKLNEIQINIIQSIIFAIAHTNSFGHSSIYIPYYIILGYFLGKIYYTSGSLTTVIIMHLLYNFF